MSDGDLEQTIDWLRRQLEKQENPNLIVLGLLAIAEAIERHADAVRCGSR